MRICLLAIVLILAAPAAALADTTVDQSKGQTIQAAVDATAAGGTIKILPGTYAENVSVPTGKNGLTLVFDPGAVVSGAGTDTTVTVASSEVKISGLTITMATGTTAALNATGGKLALTNAIIFTTAGDGVTISGADNVIQRSTILTTSAAAGADAIAQGAGGLTVDSSVLIGGAKGVAVRVTTAQGSDPATTTLNHVSSTGAGGIALEAPDAGTAQLMKVGDITLNVNASIVHGASTATESDGNVVLGLGPAASVVKATYTNSDATQMTKATDSPGEPEIAGGGSPTADTALFRAGSILRLKASAPVIDKGGPKGTESDTDIDGDARTNGAATDIGADEFTNHPPTLSLTVSPAAPKTGQIVLATGAAVDPEGREDIKGYAVDWGDGTKETSTTSVIQHAYQKAGTYMVSMVVADQSFAASATATQSVTVTDGQAPQLQVTTPKPGATVKLTRKKKKGAKKAPAPKTFLIKGVDADESGLASIELAITKKGSKCKQYNGSKLVSGGCTSYRFVKAKLSGSGFSLKVKKLAKGSYEIRARGTDSVGNATSGFDKTIKTLVSFKVK